MDWQMKLDALNAYVAEHGHAAVPARYRNSDGLRLGMLVMMFRQMYHAGKLSLERQRDLEALPGWRWEAQRRPAIERRLAELEPFAAAHPGPIHRQCNAVANGVRLLERALVDGRLTPDEQRRFAAIPFTSQQEAPYERTFARLRAYQVEAGLGAEPVPGSALACRLERARRAWRCGMLTLTHEATLTALGYGPRKVRTRAKAA